MDTALKSENQLALTSHDDFHSFKVLTQRRVSKMRGLIGRSLFSVGSMQGRQEVDVFVGGKIYRINEEVEVEEGNKKTLRRENNKNCNGGNKNIEEGK